MRVFLLGFGLIFVVCLYVVYDGQEQKKSDLEKQNSYQASFASGQQNRPKRQENKQTKQIVSRKNKFAKKPLLKIKSSLYPNFSRELFQEHQGKIFRWSKRRLSFYLEGNVTDRLTKPKIKRAFSRWQKSTEGLFIFEEAFNPNQADIIVKLTTTSEKNRLGEAGPSQFRAGDKFENMQEYIITKAVIAISQEHFSKESLQRGYQENKDQSFQTLVHEIGHVLGLMAHSSRVGDCMYFRADLEAKACNRLGIERNTLAILYGRNSLLKQEIYR